MPVLLEVHPPYTIRTKLMVSEISEEHLASAKYREIIDDPARLDRDRAVLNSIMQPGASDWLSVRQFPTYNRPRS